MPNHVTTKLIIEGPPEEIEKFVTTHVTGAEPVERRLDFDTILPMPEILRDTQVIIGKVDEDSTVEEETGFKNWFDWRCSNWGTKWNSYHFTEEPYLSGDRSYTCNFDTAWSYPQPVFEQLAEIYPRLSMVVAFFDEGFLFAGYGRAEEPVFCEATDELYREVYGAEPEQREPEFDLESEFELDMEIE